MIETIRNMKPNEREALEDVAVLVACAAFLIGWIAHILIAEPPNWKELIDVMPSTIKENIALNYCVEHKTRCMHVRNLK